jgi:polysaccharide export outer membrane protein
MRAGPERTGMRDTGAPIRHELGQNFTSKMAMPLSASRFRDTHDSSAGVVKYVVWHTACLHWHHALTANGWLYQGGQAMTSSDFFRRALLTACLTAALEFVAGATDLPKVAAASAPPAEYKLGPEDVIEVFVWKEPDLSSTVVVRPDGKITLPLANELDASGKTAVQLQEEIAKRLEQYIQRPIVNVMVKQINSLKISVLGEVRKPDVYRIKTRVTVLDAIAMAGGFTDLARPAKVVILRNTPQGQQRIKVNLTKLIDDDTAAPLYLEPLDTVYVEGH